MDTKEKARKLIPLLQAYVDGKTLQWRQTSREWLVTEQYPTMWSNLDEHGWIDTLEGGHIVCPGDYIITGVQGERYPRKPNIFEETYYTEAEYKERSSISNRCL